MRAISKHKNLIASGITGTLLEWYDFSIYGFLATIIAQQLIPESVSSSHLLYVWGIYALGFFSRPLGGIFFGNRGDQYGRRNTVLITIVLMAASTFLIGCLPNADKIGWLAPALLVLLRVIQGFAAGGEISGISVLTYESIPQQHKALVVTGVYVGSGLGIMLAGIVVSTCHHFISNAQMLQWGWRIPFLLSIVSGIAGAIIRLKTQESPEFLQKIKNTKRDTTQKPIIGLIKHHKSRLLCIALLFVPTGTCFYIGLVFLPQSLIQHQAVSAKTIITIATLCTAGCLVLSCTSAWISDKLGHQKVYVSGLFAMLITSYPTYSLIASTQLSHIVAGFILLCTTIAWTTGPMLVIALGAAPVALRFSLIGIGLNLGYSIFSGTAPLISTQLTQHFSHYNGIAGYQIILCVLAFLGFKSLHQGQVKSKIK